MRLYIMLLLVCIMAPVNAFCAVDLLGIAVDVASVEALAAIVLVGLASMWGIRKLIKTINRS